MFKNILSVAVLTLSVFAAANAQAAAGQGPQARLAAEGGSYGFTLYPRCFVGGSFAGGASAGNGQSCSEACAGMPRSMCRISYQGRPNIEQRHRGNKSHGFAQGKFHSK